MKPKDFLYRVLPQGVHYIAYPSDRKTDSGRPVYFHKSFTDPIDGIAQAQAIATAKDVFFTPAAFKLAKVFDKEKGYTRSYRKHENVAALKSFYVDVDFKMYQTPLEAQRAIKAFIDTIEIPKPNLIVASGGGVHMYWALDKAVSLEEWQPVANALALYVQKSGLRADLQVTADSARILRLPGTKNFKYDPAPECRVSAEREHDVSFSTMKEKLEPYTGQTRLDPGKFKADASVVQLFQNDNESLVHGFDPGRTYRMSEIIERCPTMSGVLERGGAGDSYPFWKNVLHLAAYCEDGREYIHALSEKHESYKPEEVEERFAESLQVRSDNARGPTTCELFSKYSQACLACKYFGHIKSPISLGTHDEKAPAEAGITYTVPGKTCMNVENADGDPIRVVIANTEIEDWMIGYDYEQGQIMSFSFKVKDRRKVFTFPVSMAADPRRLHAELLRSGVSVQSKQMKLFGDAVVSWLERLQNTQNYEEEHPFGWTEDRDGFAIAGEVYRAGEVHNTGLCDPYFTVNYAPTGTLEGWQKAMRPMMADTREEAHTMIAAAFAAPLLRFTEISAFTIAFTSLASGVGKSTFMKAGQSIWAEPIKTMSGLNDTINSASKNMAYARFMPLFYDELRGSKEMADFATLIFRAAQGKERQRLNSAAQMRAAQDINAFIIAASNHSIAEAVSERAGDSNAGVMRMFEIDMPPPAADPAHAREVTDAARMLRGHYGVAGRAFMQRVVNDLPRVNKAYANTLEWLTAKTDATSDERFWMQAGAALITVAALVRSYKIAEIDPTKVRNCVLRMVEDGRGRSQKITKDFKDHMSSIVLWGRQSLLVTDTNGFKDDVTVASAPPSRVARMQACFKTGELYVSETIVKEYARANNLVFAHVEEALVNTRTVEVVEYSIGQGTQEFSNPRSKCYKGDATTVAGSGILRRWMPKT